MTTAEKSGKAAPGEIRIAGSPTRYIQGRGAMARIGEFAGSYGLGTSALLIVDKRALPAIHVPLLSSLQESGLRYAVEEFAGECTDAEIGRLTKVAARDSRDFVIGAGGGKTLDTAKAVAAAIGSKLAILPTIASTDSPCSSVSVLYRETGEFLRAIQHPRSPDLVLVDTIVISKAPLRFLVAGMGDALSTGYEAKSCFQAGGRNSFGTKSLGGFLELATYCSKVVLRCGRSVVSGLKKSDVSESFEDLVEALIYMSGVGFESGGLAAAHSVGDGLTVVRQTHDFLHGEKVAFGLVTQLCLEEQTAETREEVLSFCADTGLPVTLSQLGLHDFSLDHLRHIATQACAQNEPIWNTPAVASVDRVMDALQRADSLGQEYLKQRQP